MEALTAFLPILVTVLMAALVVVLFSGLVMMGRGGVKGSRRSNKMMRYRVGIQAAVIVLLVVVVLLSRL